MTTGFDIDNLNAIAARRIARTYQVDALARRYTTRNLNRYQPTREEWAHAFFPGLDSRLGKLTPQQAAIEAALERIAPERQDDARAKLGLPPKPPPGTTGVRIGGTPLHPAVAKRPQQPPPPLPTEPTDHYEILDTGGLVSIPYARNLPNGGTGTLFDQTAETPAPCYLVDVNWTHNPKQAGAVHSYYLELQPYGILHTVIEDGSQQQPETGHITLGLLIDSPAVLRVHIESTPAGSQELFDGHATLSYRKVRGLKPRPEKNPDTGEPLPVSPWIGLDESVARAFDNAGIPDDWFIVRPGAPLALP